MNVKSFELRQGQMRHKGVFFHNSGWYDKNGKKIGWGDLDGNDLNKIKNNISLNEVFIILRERDSFWNFVENQELLVLCQK
jgi:hypothetical protein